MKTALRLGLIASVTVFYGFIISHLVLANLETHLYESHHEHELITAEKVFIGSLLGIWVFALSLWRVDPNLRTKGLLFGVCGILIAIAMPAVC